MKSRALLVAAAALGAVIGCSGDKSPVAPVRTVESVPKTFSAIAGDGQNSTILAALPDSLVVSIRDQRGRPLAGVTVDWSIDAGGGAISPSRTPTDAEGRAAARWVLGTAAGQLHATAQVDGMSPVVFTETARTAACPIPDDLSPAFGSLARSKARLRSGAGLTIVAIGSSSTEGVGASSSTATYPARLAAELASRFPNQSIRVVNKGISGQTAEQMLARFQNDVFANAPDLVIWQTGTVEAIGSDPVAPLVATLRQGAAQIQAHGEDLLFMDSQFYAGVGETPRYRDFQDAIAAVARESGAALVPRYALMNRYVSVRLYPLATLLSADDFHPSDLTYRCLGEYMAVGLSGG